MKAEDFGGFSALYDEVMGLYGKAVTATQKAMFFRAVAAYSLRDVRAAFDAHVGDTQRGRWAPLPADILAQIEGLAAADGRPGPEEAWSIALQSADEAASVVWTAEIAEAWGAARVVHAAGDEVGARMAFKETYIRLVAEARKRREPVAWTPTFGTCEQRRNDALRLAVDSGRLPLTALPAPAAQVAGLIELVQRRGVPEHIRAKVASRRSGGLGSSPLEAKCRAQREHDAALKAASAQRVAEYQAETAAIRQRPIARNATRTPTAIGSDKQSTKGEA